MTWLVLIAIGVATYSVRASFLLSSRAGSLPRLERYLRYVPVAVLPALATSAVMNNAGDHLDARIAAALVGALIAFKTRSVAAAMAGGMVALWLLHAAT